MRFLGTNMNDDYLVGVICGLSFAGVAYLLVISRARRVVLLSYQALLVAGLLTGCALAIIPKLEDRRLRIQKGSLYYEYCTKRSFFRDRCKDWVKDVYNLEDEDVVKKLNDYGFTCTSDRRFSGIQ